MNSRTIAALTVVLIVAGCSSSPQDPQAAKSADQVVAAIAAKIPTVKLVKSYTAADDPNHQLGRPGGYTSKAAFTDSRVPADQVEGAEPDATERGGSVEVFTDEAGAKTRADYIQAITKSLPAAAEYDYLAGPVLVRVSHLLTPDQAKNYETAIK